MANGTAAPGAASARQGGSIDTNQVAPAPAVVITRTRILRGANWVADVPVVTVSVRGDFTPGDWPAAIDLLDRLLPPGIQADRLGDPPDRLAVAIETIADQICAWAGFPPRPSARLPRGLRAESLAALPFDSESLTRAALHLSAELLSANRNGTSQAFLADALPRILALKVDADDYLKTARRYIAWAAAARGLPYRPLVAATSHVLVGEGRYGRPFDGATTWRTSAIAIRTARSKVTSHLMLDRAGVPVAQQLPVGSFIEARAAIDRLGLPMVMKPDISRRQAGVSFVYRPDDLEAAYAASSGASDTLVAESYLPGKEFRALVIDGELVSVIQHRAASVLGDGGSTIETLVAAANAERRRGPRSHGFLVSPIPWDDLARRFLASRGLAPGDVPPAGARIEIYPLPMMRLGGDFQIEVIERFHPSTKAMLLRAVAVFGLDVAGIDLRTPDPSRDWREVGAGICEVNPQPNIGLHYNVKEANARDVAGILLDKIYPPEMRGRMIHVAVVSPADRVSTGRAIADAIGKAFRWRVGLVGAGIIDLGGYRPSTPPATLFRAQGMAIEDNSLDAAVHLMTPQTVVRQGMGVRQVALTLIDPEVQDTDPAWRLVAASAGAGGGPMHRLPASEAEAARVAVDALDPVRSPAAMA